MRLPRAEYRVSVRERLAAIHLPMQHHFLPIGPMNCIFGTCITSELGFDCNAQGYENIRRMMRG